MATAALWDAVGPRHQAGHFGYSRMRRLERTLVDEYRATILEVAQWLSPQTVELAAEIAGLPDLVRGYEDVKLRAVEIYRTRTAQRLEQLRAGRLTASVVHNMAHIGTVTLRRIAITIGLLALLVTVGAVAGCFGWRHSTTINANGTSAGRTFGGIGAISGGGGNSRLLTDYPAAEQQQILDYLFKPDYGASLQILKVEIGGDTNSTDGPESSIEHTSGSVNCGNGYEWWLMEQAQARNPAIKFNRLAGRTGWIGGGASSPRTWSTTW